MFFLSWGEYMLDWCKLLTLAWSKFRVTKVQPSNTRDLRWIWLKTSGVNLEVPLQKPEPTNIKTTSSQNRLLAAPAMKHAEVMCCIFIFFWCVCVSSVVCHGGHMLMLSINANYGFQSTICYAHYATKNRKHGLRLVPQDLQPKDLRLKSTNRNKNKLFWKTTTKWHLGVKWFQAGVIGK